MSATTITIIIVLIIIGSVAVLVISQAKEKARIEKVRKINSMQDRYRRLQRFLSEIPPQYLNKELRTMIIQRGIETLNELSKFKSDPALKTKLQQDQEALKVVQASNEPPQPVQIKDEATAKEISKLLELLYRFIERQRAMKKIDQASGKKYLVYISYLISKSKADLVVTKAEAELKNGKPRIAINNYHNAISVMMRIKDNPLAVKAINGYKAKIKELDELASKQAAKPLEGQATEDTANKEWDSFLDEDDTWQKKNTYDD
ncbi:hypothetical protein [Alkalimarinus alittae]|uniref:Uncharacterized protein n=1 Tax=Alkalimarinus alittae TaxID=2961619 RepID=A0ABY6N758_9ALTE|nr:hypothetical protein [Alkalimarinus alittae]UZE97926.1 hypothetical protein NKI27_09390 [Alkalimarinus alittae]